MAGRTCDVVLTCPTLDIVEGARTMAVARARAGMECGLLLGSDHSRRGALVTCNVLYKAAVDWGARWIGYVNDDCSQFPEGWLRRLVEAVETRPEYGVAVTGAPCYSKPQADGRPGLPPALIELENPAAWVVAVVKRELFETLGYMDPNLVHYCDDSDFEMRARAAGWRTVYVQDIWINHETGHRENDWYAQDRAYFRGKWGR